MSRHIEYVGRKGPLSISQYPVSVGWAEIPDQRREGLEYSYLNEG